MGWLTGSASLTADGWHSFADASNNIVGLVGIHLAFKPRDKEHPYGHSKIETLAAMLIGGVMVAIAFEMLQGTIGKWLKHIPPQVPDYSLWVFVATIVVNIVVFSYERWAGLQLKSEVLIADSSHTATDVGISLSVLATLVGIRIGVVWLDFIVALGVIVFIGRAAYFILMRSGMVLIDTQVLPMEAVQKVAESIPGVQSTYQIRSRGKESEIYVDLHISVDPKMPTAEAHLLAHKVENAIRSAIPEVVEVIVHVEPEIGQKIVEAQR